MRSLIHALKVLVGIEAPASQVSEEELTCLLKHAQRAEVIVEIGCYEGSTTAALASITEGHVYSIDPFVSGRLGVCYGEVVARSVRWRRRLNNIQFLKAFSYDIAPEFQRSVDFIFIDADHNYEAIKKDWHDWLPKLRAGGIIALHDCHLAENSPHYLGSMKFYEEDISKMSGIREIESVGSLAVFEVRPPGQSTQVA